MADKKKEMPALTPDGIAGGNFRIRGISGAGYIGHVEGVFGNAIIMKTPDNETVILKWDAIEAMYDGLDTPVVEQPEPPQQEQKDV
jgi:hypothetical protein